MRFLSARVPFLHAVRLLCALRSACLRGSAIRPMGTAGSSGSAAAPPLTACRALLPLPRCTGSLAGRGLLRRRRPCLHGQRCLCAGHAPRTAAAGTDTLAAPHASQQRLTQQLLRVIHVIILVIIILAATILAISMRGIIILAVIILVTGAIVRAAASGQRHAACMRSVFGDTLRTACEAHGPAVP